MVQMVRAYSTPEIVKLIGGPWCCGTTWHCHRECLHFFSLLSTLNSRIVWPLHNGSSSLSSQSSLLHHIWEADWKIAPTANPNHWRNRKVWGDKSHNSATEKKANRANQRLQIQLMKIVKSAAGVGNAKKPLCSNYSQKQVVCHNCVYVLYVRGSKPKKWKRNCLYNCCFKNLTKVKNTKCFKH